MEDLQNTLENATVTETETERQEKESFVIPARFKIIKPLLIAGVLASIAMTFLFLTGIAFAYDKKMSLLGFLSGIVAVSKINGASWPKYLSVFAASCLYVVTATVMIKKTVTVVYSYLRLKKGRAKTEEAFCALCGKYKKTIRNCLSVYFNLLFYVLFTEALKKYSLSASGICVLTCGAAISLGLAFAYRFTEEKLNLKTFVVFAAETIPVYAVCALIYCFILPLEYIYKTLNGLIVLFGGYGSFCGLNGVLNTLWVCLAKSVLYVVFLVVFIKTLRAVTDMSFENFKECFIKLVAVSAIMFGGYLLLEVLIFSGENASVSVSDIINPETRNAYIPLLLFSFAGLIFETGKEKDSVS